MGELILKDEVYAMIGAAIEVHTCLGSGFLKAVYQEAMEIECKLRDLPFEAQLLNDLKATGMKVGVLINFGSHPKREWKRLVC